MEDSKILERVPDLPPWVKTTKREIHEILVRKDLEGKKEQSMDKLPIVITELLKVEDKGWARVFDSTNALAQFLARRCKFKEAQARPLVSVMKDAGLFTELGEGKKKGKGDTKIRVASREKLIQVAKSLSSTAKEVAKDEEVSDDKRAVAKQTAHSLRVQICQGVSESKEKKKAEKPWDKPTKKSIQENPKHGKHLEQQEQEQGEEAPVRKKKPKRAGGEGTPPPERKVVDEPEGKDQPQQKKGKRKKLLEEELDAKQPLQSKRAEKKVGKKRKGEEAGEGLGKRKKAREVESEEGGMKRSKKGVVEDEHMLVQAEEEKDDRDPEPVYHTDAALLAAFDAI
eukprot:TRINITY_DN19363_c0_g1_i2.p1 TRINITY_DN19363_c0_g1~~TRINITY_DN19363_c0_g1_i2.p1  ORF type:complete len:341 (+),score=140.93 TRINITY_DN19363_c0_g1_i2:236-1258(+)